MLRPRHLALLLGLLPACGASDPPVSDDVPRADVVRADVPSPDVLTDSSLPDSVADTAAPLDGSAPDASPPDLPPADVAVIDAPLIDVAEADVPRADVADVPLVPDAGPPGTFLPTYPLTARFPEGGTFDPTSHRFFVGSLADGSVHRINATTGAGEVLFRETAPGRWWTLGMDVDVARRRLAVCAMDDRRALGDSAHPYDGYVWVFDIDTGMRVARHPLAPAFATATCTDVAYAADGTLYVCDREHPRIYRITPTGTLSTLVTNSLLGGGVIGQNALLVLPDQSALLSLVYLPSRLVRVRLRDLNVSDVTLRGSFYDGLPLLSGADGMTFSGGAVLVAFTSQVTRVTPTLADWSTANAATIDVPAGMTDMVHTPSGDFLLNGQAVSFAFDRTPDAFQLVRFLGTF